MSVGGRLTGCGRWALLLVLCLAAAAAPSHRTKARHGDPVETATARDTPPRISDIRCWSFPDTTRVAVEITGDFSFKYDRLTNPDRIFFDIAGVRPANLSKIVDTRPVNDRLIKKIRIAESTPGSTRVVLDVAVAVDVSASQLSNPSRLMIEVWPAGARRAEPASVAVAAGDRPAEPAPVAARPGPPKPEPLRAVATKPEATVLKAEASPVRVEAAPPGPLSVLSAAPASIRAPSVTPAPPEKTAAEDSSSKAIDAAALAAKRTATGERSMTRVLGLKLGKVVLDPGHGGHDAGTHGPTGLLEKDLVLDVTKRLGELIQTRLGSEVILTRDDDTYVPLEERTRMANRHKADLFLSIHANSSPAKSVSGIETYYLNFTSSKSALEVAARENASSERSIYDLKDLVQKIALKDKLDESREFAERVQTPLAALSARTNSRSRDRGVKKAPFVVLIGASMPSVLVEVGFVTNPNDEAQMKKPEYRQKIAEAIYKGIAQYASGLSHFEVAKRKSAE